MNKKTWQWKDARTRAKYQIQGMAYFIKPFFVVCRQQLERRQKQQQAGVSSESVIVQKRQEWYNEILNKADEIKSM